MLLRTTIERNPIIPILKITKTCIANPSLTNSIKQSALLSEITKMIELAERFGGRFGGRLLNSEEYPNLEKNEEIGVLVQLIFQNNKELEKFELKLAFSNTK